MTFQDEAIQYFVQSFLMDLTSNEPDMSNQHLMHYAVAMMAALFTRYPELMYDITVNSLLNIGREDDAVEDYKRALETISELGIKKTIEEIKNGHLRNPTL